MRLLPLFKLPHVGQFITIRRASLFQFPLNNRGHVSGVPTAGMIPQFNLCSAAAGEAAMPFDQRGGKHVTAYRMTIYLPPALHSHPLTDRTRGGSIEARVDDWDIWRRCVFPAVLAKRGSAATKTRWHRTTQTREFLNRRCRVCPPTSRLVHYAPTTRSLFDCQESQ